MSLGRERESVAAENERPGTGNWWSAPHAPPEAIEGYTTQNSVLPGDPVSLCVSTRPAARYEARIYRLGWYAGAGGRDTGSVARNVGLQRHPPPPDPVTGIIRAGWPVTDVLLTEADWVSGQYLIVLTLTSGPHAGAAARIPFAVRPTPGESPAILVQIPVNTAQAYNGWGGKSLYDSNSSQGVAAVKASFDRPLAAWGEANLNARAPFIYELPLIRFLEREGFELAYQTNVDTHRDPSSLLGPRLVISSGHDEYWTREMRDAFDDALARGVSLAFMGANTAYWQTAYEDEERTMVMYRHAGRDPEPDHARKTIRFRDLHPPRPERDLIGQQYENGLQSVSRRRAFHFTDEFSSDRWAAGVDLDAARPLERLVGYEWDTFDRRNPPPQAVRILHSDDGEIPADCIRWTSPSGARVFSGGSLQFSWGLDDWASPGTADDRLQQILRVGLREMCD